MTKNSKENRARSCARLVNDEAVIEVVAVLLLYHVQLLEPQVHVEDGLKTVYNLTEIVIEEVWQRLTIFSRSRPIMNPIDRYKFLLEILRDIKSHPRFGRYSMTIMLKEVEGAWGTITRFPSSPRHCGSSSC